MATAHDADPYDGQMVEITPEGSRYRQFMSRPYHQSYVDENGVRRQANQELRLAKRPTSKYCVATREGSNPPRPCNSMAMKGQNVCKHHSGSHKHKDSARMSQLRRGIEEATKTLHQLGIPVPEAERKDPREILLDAVQQAWALKEALKYLLTAVTEDDVEGIGKIIRVQGADGGVAVIPHEGGAMAATRLRLYNEALDRSAKLSKIAIDAGIEDRMVRLAERQAEIIIAVIKAAVAELPAELQFKVVSRAADELRLRAGAPIAALT